MSKYVIHIDTRLNKLTLLGFFLSVLTGFALASTTLWFFQYRQSKQTLANQPVNALAIETKLPQTTPNLTKSLTVLLLGYGGEGHDGGYLTDVIQLAHFDFERQILAFISIPRDLWIKLEGGYEGKINSVLTQGASGEDKIKQGAQLTKQVITAITGLPVNYFIGIDFVGFQRAIGLELKGIDVNVEETLDDPWYPIKGEELNLCGMSPEEIIAVHQKYSGFELEKQFKCRYERILFKPGKVHMEGDDALKYVRSRHGSDGGDFSRSKRQQEVLLAIRDKLFSLNALDKLPGFFKEIVTHTSTDIDLEIVQSLVPLLKTVNNFQVKNINLSTENVLTNGTSSAGAFILIPRAGLNNWEEVREYIKNELN